MNTIVLRVIWRVFLVVAVVAGPSAFIVNEGAIPLWLNALGVVAIAFAFGGSFLDFPRAAKFFTRDVIGQAQLHFLSLQGFRLYVMLGAAQAIHWRAIGHTTGFVDSAASIVIRVLGDLATIGLFLTAGRFDDNVSWNRIGKVGLIIATVVAIVFLAASQDRAGVFGGDSEQTVVTPQGIRP